MSVDNSYSLLNVSQLRKLAEDKVTQVPEDVTGMTVDQIKKTFHELRVHQIELEMQNEELRRFQEALDSEKARYFELYDLAPVGYCTISQSGMIMEANLTAADMLGMVKGELVGRPIARLILHADQDIYYKSRQQLADSGVLQECDLRLIRKDGSSFWVRMEIVPGGDDSATKIYRTVLIDINDRKLSEDACSKAENHAHQSQKLESLGVVAGGVAHDFNNLMGGIYGFIELALCVTREPEVIKYLTQSLDTIDRARALTRQLLTFAKGGAPVRKIMPLKSVVKETVLFALSGSNLSCRFKIDDDLWSCNVDKNQLCQVIDNIVINAVQAMPGGGVFEVNAVNLVVKGNKHLSLPAGKYVRISFKDKGVGIPRELFTKIFDPFFSTKVMGSGLGLATSYSIIRQHGGCIEVESEIDKGSVFHVYLPMAEGVEIQKKESALNHVGKGTVIFMDDEAALRKIVKTQLESFGYHVICADNGESAVAAFMQETGAGRDIAAVILDLTVPDGMGGLEAVAKIRKINNVVPVLVSSGYADDQVMNCPGDYGFTDSLFKPFLKSELGAMLEKYIQEIKVQK